MEEFSNENVEINQTLPENEPTSTSEENSITALVGGVMQEQNIQKITTKQRVIKILVQVGLYLFLGVMALIVLFPFYYMLAISVKEFDEYYLIGKNYQNLTELQQLYPQTLAWHNYADAFKAGALDRLFLNTMYVGIISTILSLVITVLSAFAFARLEFKGKNILFAGLLATMMIPGELFTITNFITVNKLGWAFSADWTELSKALILPFLVSIFYIYLLKQNFQQIPNELYLAAKVDGTTDLKYLWKVMIPLALPTIISITILKMMGAWNTYLWPKLITDEESHMLITNGLRTKFSAEGSKPQIPQQMAAVAMVSAPLFMVFIFLRKYIMKGVSRSGIKG